jgi:hypothetical protein
MSLHLLSDYVWIRKLNLNVNTIKQSCIKMESFINENFPDYKQSPLYEQTNKVLESNSPDTTNAYFDYNLMLYPQQGFHELFVSIRETFNLIRRKNNIKFNQFYMQCWLNTYDVGQKLEWHGHFPPEVKSWHGFYCVNVKDSITSYRIPPNGGLININCADDLLVISKSDGDTHCTSDWTHENDKRITIAFDIVPAPFIASQKMLLNHWIPL